MKKAKKLHRAERLELSILLGKKYSLRKIARALGRSPNTISEEMRKNKTRRGYDPQRAHEKARLRLRFRRFQWRKIEENPELRQYVIRGLKAHWNPDEIAGNMKQNKAPFYASKTAIYDWLHSSRGQYWCKYLYSRRYQKKKRTKTTKRSMIPNRVDITRRFRGAGNRTRYGHWEDDTVVGRKGTAGGLKVGYERKARLVIARKVRSMSPDEHARIERAMFRNVKTLSITRDNGIENKRHEALGIPSFFCRPYASWQKGGVENANKMIRRYFPKGTNFSHVSQRDIDHVVSIINRKPRKILGYRSAFEVARDAGIINNAGVLFRG
jgi:transposase, IS30 family